MEHFNPGSTYVLNLATALALGEKQ